MDQQVRRILEAATLLAGSSSMAGTAVGRECTGLGARDRHEDDAAAASDVPSTVAVKTKDSSTVRPDGPEKDSESYFSKTSTPTKLIFRVC